MKCHGRGSSIGSASWQALPLGDRGEVRDRVCGLHDKRPPRPDGQYGRKVAGSGQRVPQNGHFFF